MVKRGIVFLFLVLVFAFGCKKDKNKDTQQADQYDTLAYEETVLPFEEEFQIVDSAVDVDTSVTDEVLTVDTATNTITPISEEKVTQGSGKIYIIVGSFKNYENAVKAKRYYERLGYKPQILPKVAGYNRVAIEEHTDLTQARQRLNQLRKKFNRPDFWLLYKPSDF